MLNPTIHLVIIKTQLTKIMHLILHQVKMKARFSNLISNPLVGGAGRRGIFRQPEVKNP